MFVNGQIPATIEIPLKNGSYCFPQTEFSNQKFLLRSIDAYLQLKDAILQWIKENKSTTYDDYQSFVSNYASVLPDPITASPNLKAARKSAKKSRQNSPAKISAKKNSKKKKSLLGNRHKIFEPKLERRRLGRDCHQFDFYRREKRCG